MTVNLAYYQEKILITMMLDNHIHAVIPLIRFNTKQQKKPIPVSPLLHYFLSLVMCELLHSLNCKTKNASH